MEVNQTVWPRPLQRSVITVLMAENCKLCEFYLRMYVVYGEGCCSPLVFINGLKLGLTRRAWVKKTVQGNKPTPP